MILNDPRYDDLIRRLGLPSPAVALPGPTLADVLEAMMAKIEKLERDKLDDRVSQIPYGRP